MKKNYYYEWLVIVPEVKEQYFTKRLDNPQLYETPLLPDVCFIEFAQGGRIYYAMIDMACLSMVVDHRWGSRGDGYVSAEGDYLHRMILNENRSDYDVHHKAAKFDNRTKNLESVHYTKHSKKRAYRGTLKIDEFNILQIAQLLQ